MHFKATLKEFTSWGRYFEANAVALKVLPRSRPDWTDVTATQACYMLPASIFQLSARMLKSGQPTARVSCASVLDSYLRDWIVLFSFFSSHYFSGCINCSVALVSARSSVRRVLRATRRRIGWSESVTQHVKRYSHRNNMVGTRRRVVLISKGILSFLQRRAFAAIATGNANGRDGALKLLIILKTRCQSARWGSHDIL